MSSQLMQEKLNKYLSYLKQDENNVSLLLEITNFYLELNQLDQAQLYLHKATELDKEFTLGHQGILYFKQGLYAEAKACFLESLSYFDDVNLRFHLSFIYYLEGELTKAWEQLVLLKETADHLPAQVLMARILQEQGDLKQAIDVLANLLESNPTYAEALGFLSLIYFDLNESELAEKVSKQALLHDAENYDARLVQMLIGLVTQQINEEELDNLLQIKPRDARLWFISGNTFLQKGDVATAEKHFQQALEIAPFFYDCYIILAWCQLLRDTIDAAQQNYQKATELEEELADGWGGLALVAALKQDFSTAEQLIYKANQLNPACLMTELATTFCLTYQHPERAKAQLVKLLKQTHVPMNQKLLFMLEDMENTSIH